MIIVCSSVSLLACDIFPLPFLRFQLSLKFQISHPSYPTSTKESQEESQRLAFEFRKYSSPSHHDPSIHQITLLVIRSLLFPPKYNSHLCGRLASETLRSIKIILSSSTAICGSNFHHEGSQLQHPQCQ